MVKIIIIERVEYNLNVAIPFSWCIHMFRGRCTSQPSCFHCLCPFSSYTSFYPKKVIGRRKYNPNYKWKGLFPYKTNFSVTEPLWIFVLLNYLCSVTLKCQGATSRRSVLWGYCAFLYIQIFYHKINRSEIDPFYYGDPLSSPK